MSNQTYATTTSEAVRQADLPPSADTSGHSNHVNVGDGERIVSALAGMVLTGLAITQRKNAQALPLGLAGGYMLYRGASGYCPTYAALRTGTADPLKRSDSQVTVIPHGQGIKVTKAMTVQKSPTEMYAYWRDFTNLPKFMTHLENVVVLDSTHSVWTARAPFGQTVTWHAEIIADEPGKMIAWRSIDPADIPNAGSVRFETLPANRGTAITVSLEYNPPAGMLGAVIAKLFGEEPGAQVQDSLRKFKSLMETGEIATIAGQPNGMTLNSAPENGVVGNIGKGTAVSV